jgi:hypothetical protein
MSIPSSLTLTLEQYTALVALAQKSTLNPDCSVNQEKALRLNAFLQDIEQANGITRYLLWVQWQSPDAPLPPTANFPAVWPPEMRYQLQLTTRPINKADVLALVAQRAPRAVNILVTADPAALVGWSKLDDYFQA